MVLVKIWKWLKLLDPLPFIKETLVNQVYIPIWSFWPTCTVLQWMKTNSKISQFSNFLLWYGYVIFVKISKWLKLLNSVPFRKKTPVNHFYIWIWSFWLIFKAWQWMNTNFKISQFEDFCEGPGMQFWSKFENDWNFLILFHSARKHLKITSTFVFDHFDCFSQLYSEWRETSKLVNFKISAKVRLCDFLSKFEND